MKSKFFVILAISILAAIPSRARYS